MANDKSKKSTPADDVEQLERDILSERKFTLAEAIGRLGGGDLMKGASPVTKKRQAALILEHYLEQNLTDSEGALETVLLRRVSEGDALMQTAYEDPLRALADFVQQTLDSQQQLERFVTAVDREWGRMYRERPHFQQSSQRPDEDDPYTFTNVRTKLQQLREQLSG